MTPDQLVAAFASAGYDTQEQVVGMLTMAKLTLSSQAKKQAAIAARAVGQTANSQAQSQAAALEASAAADEAALRELIAQQQSP